MPQPINDLVGRIAHLHGCDIHRTIPAAYLIEMARILKTGGMCLIHHSNNDRNPGLPWNQNPHARNFMNAKIFRHLAMRAGLTVLHQDVISWGYKPEEQSLDCLTLCQKP